VEGTPVRTTRSLRLWLATAFVPLLLWPGFPAAQGSTTDQTIRLYQHQVVRSPFQATAYHRLGDAYVQKARETGDATYITLAEEALRKALALTPGSSAVRRHLAYALYFRHAFPDAAAEAREAIALDPTDSHAHGILGDAYLETGRYAEARQTYDRMIALDQSLYALSRRAGLRSLEGDPAGAIEDLDRAIADGQVGGRPPESIAWAQWQLGMEYATVGNRTAAADAYLAALETYPRYHRALAALAHVRATEGRHPEAIRLYEQAIAIVPQPDYVAGLGDLLAKAGQAAAARQQYALVEYIGRLSVLNQVLYNRELAYFYADHDVNLDQALELARRELEVRHDIYAYDVLAWALYKNGQPEAAREAMSEALRLRTRDARLFFHAGLIEHRLGNREAAREYLERALATNPHFHVLQADLARRVLTELGGTSAPTQTQEARHGQ